MFNTDRHSIVKHLQDYKEYCYEYNNEFYYISEEEMQPIKEFLNNETILLKDLSDKYHIKNDTLKRRLSATGIDYNHHYLVQYNRNKFDNITTEEQAYWLGFILADGYINEERNFLCIKLGAIDQKHLYKFADFIELKNPENYIKECYGGAYSRNNLCYSLTLNGKSFIESLKKYNLFQNKSGKEIPYIFDNQDLNSAYIRGMVDGDGHIDSRGLKYVGSFESCNYIKNYFISQGTICKDSCEYIYDYGTIKSLELMNKEACCVIKKLYENASIYLDRKYWFVINKLEP